MDVINVPEVIFVNHRPYHVVQVYGLHLVEEASEWIIALHVGRVSIVLLKVIEGRVVLHNGQMRVLRRRRTVMIAPHDIIVMTKLQNKRVILVNGHRLVVETFQNVSVVLPVNIQPPQMQGAIVHVLIVK